MALRLWEFESPRPHNETSEIPWGFHFPGIVKTLAVTVGNCLGNSWGCSNGGEGEQCFRYSRALIREPTEPGGQRAHFDSPRSRRDLLVLAFGEDEAHLEPLLFHGFGQGVEFAL